MKIFKGFSIALLMVAALFLSACATGPIVGTVENRAHHEAYSYVTNVCGSYNEQGICTVNIPIWNDVPEKWSLDVRDSEGNKRRAYVTPGEWESYKIGDHYSDAHKYKE